nr:hypothetical protein [Catenulispora rubra]
MSVTGDERGAQPQPEQDRRAQQSAGVVARGLDLRQPRHRRDGQRRAADQERLGTDPGRQRLRGAGRDQDGQGRGHEGEAGLDRAEAEHVLDELHVEEEHPEQRGAQGEHGQVAAGPVPVGEQPQRGDRFGRRALGDQERGEQHRGGGEGAEGPGVAPAVVAGPDEPVDQRGDAGRRGQRADQVEAPGSARGLRDAQRGQQHDRRADRQVHEEDPAPAQPLRQQAAGQQADRPAAAGDTGVHAQRPGARGTFPERGGDQRQRGR